MTQKKRIVLNTLGKPLSLILALGGAIAAGTYLPSRQASAEGSAPRAMAEARTMISHNLPKLDGNHLEAKVVEVTYGPGGSSPAHSHPCPVIAVVVEGAIRSQVKGEREATYKTGQSFYEAPNGVHLISANADKTRPAKLLAFFVCDHETADAETVPEGKRTQ